MLHHISHCVGIEKLSKLIESAKHSEALLNTKLSTHIRPTIEWVHNDILNYKFNFNKKMVIFIHGTSYDDQLFSYIETELEKCIDGTIVISVTKKIKSKNYKKIHEGDYSCSWGDPVITVYIKENNH